MPDQKEEKKVKHENIYAALSAFQGELQPMEKKGEVEFQTKGGQTVKFSYTPLGDIMKAIYPLLGKHGLSVRHEITKEGVEAILTHETFKSRVQKFKENDKNMPTDISKEVIYKTVADGEIRSGLVNIYAGHEMKETGAAITYARRYSLTLVLGISSEEDKDATLFEQSAQNAIQYAFNRARKGLEEAKTVDAVDKAEKVIKKDYDLVLNGKAGALGLTKENYEELLNLAKAMRRTIEEKNKTDDAK